MVKSIVSVGRYIEGCVAYDYNSKGSLRDFEIVIFWLTSEWESSCGFHWRNEIRDVLSNGKNIYFIVDSVGRYFGDILRGGNDLHFRESHGTIVNYIDSQFKPMGNLKFGYEGFFSEPQMLHQYKALYATNDGKLLGFIKKWLSGNIVFLPKIITTGSDKIESIEKEDEDIRNTILKFDKNICSLVGEEPIPERITNDNTLKTKAVKELEKSIKDSKELIEENIKKIESFEKDLKEENIFLFLLYGTGKSLENAVSKALKLLGYKVSNYNDGILELDQIIETNDGRRFIGECKGREGNVDIKDFRQLFESTQRDYERDEITERAIGILFGNTERLKPLEERGSEAFTTKVLTSAKASNIILVKTPDLFFAIKYIIDNPNDEEFKEKCRQAIETSQGKIVEFPKPIK